MVHLENGYTGHGGDPVGPGIEPSTEYNDLLGPGAESRFGHVINEASPCDG